MMQLGLTGLAGNQIALGTPAGSVRIRATNGHGDDAEENDYASLAELEDVSAADFVELTARSDGVQVRILLGKGGTATGGGVGYANIWIDAEQIIAALEAAQRERIEALQATIGRLSQAINTVRAAL